MQRVVAPCCRCKEAKGCSLLRYIQTDGAHLGAWPLEIEIRARSTGVEVERAGDREVILDCRRYVKRERDPRRKELAVAGKFAAEPRSGELEKASVALADALVARFAVASDPLSEWWQRIRCDLLARANENASFYTEPDGSDFALYSLALWVGYQLGRAPGED